MTNVQLLVCHSLGSFICLKKLRNILLSQGLRCRNTEAIENSNYVYLDGTAYFFRHVTSAYTWHIDYCEIEGEKSLLDAH